MKPRSLAENYEAVYGYGVTMHEAVFELTDSWSILSAKEIMFPRLIEVRGWVYRNGPAPIRSDSVSEILNIKEEEFDPSFHVDSFNWIEIGADTSGSFKNVDEEILHEVCYSAALVVVESWRLWLPSQFPSRVFDVHVMSPEDTGGGYGVKFTQKSAQ